jgi:hypothetical protein
MASLESIKSLAQRGKKINAIKQLKDTYNQLGLKEAKNIVEALVNGSLSIPEAEARLKPYLKLTSAVESGYESPAGRIKHTNLITKNKIDYTKTVLIIIVLILLAYIVYLKL